MEKILCFLSLVISISGLGIKSTFFTIINGYSYKNVYGKMNLMNEIIVNNHISCLGICSVSARCRSLVYYNKNKSCALYLVSLNENEIIFNPDTIMYQNKSITSFFR